MATSAYEELVERATRKAICEQMPNGKPLWVLLADNGKTAVDLHAPIRAALAEALHTLKTVTPEMEANGNDVPGTGWPDEPGGFPDVTQVYLAMLSASPLTPHG
jgi:hypothetical protein